MRAAYIEKYGPPEVVTVRDVPRPTIKSDEVLIRVAASTVSAADHRARSADLPKGLGLMLPVALGWPRPRAKILGMDVAGTIEAVGAAVTGFAPGDEVFALLGFGYGGHAEYAVKKAAGAIALKPASLDFAEAVALVFGGTTATTYLDRADLKPGDEVLVNGASGSVGTAAVQIAKARGARVTAVTSQALELGADEVIDYRSTDFAALDRQWDVIVECVGNAPFARVEQCLKPGGTLLLVIQDLHSMLTQRRDSARSGKLVTGSAAAATGADLAALAALADSGRLTPVIDSAYDLGHVVAAHRRVDTGHKRGNVVLRIR